MCRRWPDCWSRSFENSRTRNGWKKPWPYWTTGNEQGHTQKFGARSLWPSGGLWLSGRYRKWGFRRHCEAKLFRMIEQLDLLFVERVVAQHLLERGQQMTLLARVDVELDRRRAAVLRRPGHRALPRGVENAEARALQPVRILTDLERYYGVSREAHSLTTLLSAFSSPGSTAHFSASSRRLVQFSSTSGVTSGSA